MNVRRLLLTLAAFGSLGIAIAQDAPLPAAFSLARNYPNPFNPETTIDFSLPDNCNARLEVFNMYGQKVATVVHGARPAGRHSVQWRGCDDENHVLPSGIYLYKFSTTQTILTRKMLLLRLW